MKAPIKGLPDAYYIRMEVCLDHDRLESYKQPAPVQPTRRIAEKEGEGS